MRVGVMALLLGIAATARPVAAQTRVCKSVDLKRIGPDGYTARGNRCDGILEKEVGGEVIRVVGLTQGIEDFDPMRGSDLRLQWSAPPMGDSVWLLAVSVRPRLHYQMDAALRGGSSEFRWPVTVLRGENIRRDDLALLAWTTQPAIAERVLLPVRLAQQKPAAVRDSAPLLVVVPANRLKALRISIAAADSLGRTTRWIRQNEARPGSDFRDGQPATIRLSDAKTPGLYRVRATGDLYASVAGAPVQTTSVDVLIRIAAP